ncbi:acylneuraminate cytidylyltransferase [bacterium]|nr:acylneuraminate cytidylyltransferase [bacterium]|tara:strand:+ start:1125 stop:1808 length:684 start_codon:yes stop_codon:yes gene_type:complete
MKILAIIPARGGSKGIPRKNILEIAGKPLIAHSILTALKVKLIDKLIVSTDDEEISDISKHYGADVPFLRPKDYAKDDSPGYLTALHAISEFPSYSDILLLQPTSPLRNIEDIEGIIKLRQKSKAKSAVSVTYSWSHPEWCYTLNKNSMNLTSFLKKKDIFHNRQNLDSTYIPNGALYFCNSKWLQSSKKFIGEDTKAFIMPPERSIDIDSHLDWFFAEKLLEREFK